MGMVKLQFPRLCYSKCRISEENLSSSASPSVYILQADLLMGTLRSYEIPLNSGDGEQRHAGLWSERWEGCAYPHSYMGAEMPTKTLLSPAAGCAGHWGSPITSADVALLCWPSEL